MTIGAYGYLAQRGDYRLELVAVGLDSARDRIEVQGSLVQIGL